MKTGFSRKLKRWIMLLLPLLVVGIFLAACDGDDDDVGGGGGLDETPDITETEVFEEDTPIVEMTDEPIVEETPIIEETEELGETPAVFPTPVMTGTLEATDEAMTDTVTPEAEATEVMTETGAAVSVGVVQVSELVDIEVWNQFGEEIGSVTEILARQDGTIEHVIVDLNAFVNDNGLGTDVDTTDFVAETDLVALTWDNISLQQDAGDDEILGDDDDFVAVMNGNMAADMNLTPLDPNFLTFLDSGDHVMDEGLDLDMDVPAEYTGLIQLSEYDDFDLEETTANDLGDMEDLLIDLSNGQVMYAVVDVGGFLGIGETNVAIPWSAVTLDQATLDADEEIFRTDVDETFLESAPTIDLDDWDFDVDEGWDEEFQTYWSDFIEA